MDRRRRGRSPGMGAMVGSRREMMIVSDPLHVRHHDEPLQNMLPGDTPNSEDKPTRAVTSLCDPAQDSVQFSSPHCAWLALLERTL